MNFLRRNWLSLLGGLLVQGGMVAFDTYMREKEREEMKAEIEDQIRNEMYQEFKEKESI